MMTKQGFSPDVSERERDIYIYKCEECLGEVREGEVVCMSCLTSRHSRRSSRPGSEKKRCWGVGDGYRGD
jgi:hypothetical protein